MTTETVTLAFVLYLFARYVIFDVWMVHAATKRPTMERSPEDS
jgi:hypothetical protein